MTEATTKKDPFDFLFFYDESDLGEREEDALLVGGDDPSTASPLHLAIGIKEAKQIVIRPISDVTRVSSSNYHFKLQFTPGILLQPEQITVEGDDWGLQVEGDTILYLLWKGEEITLDDTNSLELMLNGVMGTLAPAVRASQTNVTLSWEFKRGGITVIDVTAKAPGDSNPYNNTATENLEMIQRQGKANIPLYVGFFSSNRVLNTDNQESNLKLRITNTSESAITFNYDGDATNRSQLIVALEVGDAGTVPWALGTADQVNDVELSIAGDKWQPAGPTNKGSTLEWTFSPKSADISLAAKETLVIELSKIVTAHPTGTANLYLRYKYVPGYQDGEFICPIEKAPLVFPEKNVGIGTTTPSKKFEVVGYGSSKQLVSVRGDHVLSLELRSVNKAEVYYELADGNNGIENSWKIGSNDDGKLHFGYGTVGGFNSQEKMTILTDGNVGIGTTTPDVQLHVKETIKAKKIVADGAVFTGMILMWSGAADKIPTGWKLCDGNNGTPDLRNRFLVGAGDDYPVNNKGGQNQVTLSVGELPKHSHDVEDRGHSHALKVQKGKSDNANDRDVMLPAGDDVYPTNHVTSNFTILEKGDGKPFDIRPLYYALCFIMKVEI
jgi:hypothetical protein